MTHHESRRRWQPGVRLSLLTLTLAALGLAPASAAAQSSLYMPRAITQTYRNGTRSMDGLPGAKYWQNRGRYAITISTDAPGSPGVGHRADRLREQQPRHTPGARDQAVPQLSQARRSSRRRRVWRLPHLRRPHPLVRGERHGDDSGTTIPRYFTWQPVRLPTALAPHDSVRLAFAGTTTSPSGRAAKVSSIPPGSTSRTSIPASPSTTTTTGGIRWTTGPRVLQRLQRLRRLGQRAEELRGLGYRHAHQRRAAAAARPAGPLQRRRSASIRQCTWPPVPRSTTERSPRRRR